MYFVTSHHCLQMKDLVVLKGVIWLQLVKHEALISLCCAHIESYNLQYHLTALELEVAERADRYTGRGSTGDQQWLQVFFVCRCDWTQESISFKSVPTSKSN